MRPVPILPCVVATWCAFCVESAHAEDTQFASADAQAVKLEVRAPPPNSARCFAPDALQERIAHYVGTRGAKSAALRFELLGDGPDTAEFQIYRDEMPASRRRFEHLPTSCSERRDSVALSIALSLEGAGEETAAVSVPATVSSSAPEPVAETIRQPASAQPSAVAKPSAAQASPVAAEPERERDQQDSAADVLPDADPAGISSGPSVQLHAGARALTGALPSPVWTGGLGAALVFGSDISFACADTTIIGGLCVEGCRPDAASDAGASDASACDSGIGVLARKRLDLVLVVDDAASLAPWQYLRKGLDQFLQDEASTGIGVGLQRFGDACDPQPYASPIVPIAPLQQNLSVLQAAIPATASITSSTNPAVEGAIRYARGWAAANSDAYVAVVLLTDASPGSCDALTGHLEQAAAKITRDGYEGTPSIPTYVVGFGSLPTTTTLARSGGTEPVSIGVVPTDGMSSTGSGRYEPTRSHERTSARRPDGPHRRRRAWRT